jgi:2-oxoisovalerate dehydrogenase E2 component (dihydrolipoyl transacylase)
MSTTTITMPQLGETVTEGTITRWLKNVGDRIEKYEAFAEVATDKVNAEIPSPLAGVLLAILVAEGETVPTGAPIASIGLPDGVVVPAAQPTTPAVAASSEPAAPAAAPLSATPAVAATYDYHGQRFSPAVRRALREHNIDPSTVKGTGTDGRVTLADVERAATSAPLSKNGKAHAPTPVPQAGTTRTPLTRARRSIAEHMVHASQTIPHAWTMVEIDVTKLVHKRHAERDRLRAELGFIPTYFQYFAHAVVATLASHPMMNARFTADAIETYGHVDLSFAIALEGTLVVPVVHGTQAMSFVELARAMSSVTERARSGRLSLAELQGGTITVNNTGANGSILSKPIINGGQAAIVTMEAIVKRPVVVEGDAIAIRSMLNVCCTIDHRVIDGNVVGAFLRDLKMRLTNIE